MRILQVLIATALLAGVIGVASAEGTKHSHSVTVKSYAKNATMQGNNDPATLGIAGLSVTCPKRDGGARRRCEKAGRNPTPNLRAHPQNGAEPNSARARRGGGGGGGALRPAPPPEDIAGPAARAARPRILDSWPRRPPTSSPSSAARCPTSPGVYLFRDAKGA